MSRVYPPIAPVAPPGRIYPPVPKYDYWSVPYRLDNAIAVTASANVSFAQLPNGDIEVTVAAGKTPDANPTTGATIAWNMIESVTGKITTFPSPLAYQGVAFSWLGVVSGLGGANGVELSVGTAASVNLLTSASVAGSLTDVVGLPVAAWRFIAPGTFTRVADAGPTGLSTAVFLDPWHNASTGGLISSQPAAIGSTSLTPRQIANPGSPFDIALGAGNVGIGPYFVLNIRNAALANVAATRVYVVRPRLLCVDWAA